MSKFYIILISVITLLTVRHAHSQVSNPAGTLQPTADEDIWAQTLSGSHFNEFWNYQFYLNNDMTVHITYSLADFGSLKSAVSGVQVSVYNLDGQLYQLSREYDIEHLIQDKERYIFRNRMGRDIFFEGKLPENHRVRVLTTKNNITYDIDLNLSNIQDGFKWGNGKYRIGDEEVGIISHIPYAQVNGYVEVDGIRKLVQGTAYMDHTFQNRTTTQLMNSGYRYVYHNSANEWDIFYFMLPNHSSDQRTIGYRVQKNNNEIEHQGINRILSRDMTRVNGNNVAQTVKLEFSNGETTQLLRTTDHEKFSVLSELGQLTRSVARRFLGGEVIHYRGKAALLEPAKRRKDGYYNYFIIE